MTDIEQFQLQVRELADAMFGTDDEGDPRVEVTVVDRRVFNRDSYLLIPYVHRACSDDDMFTILGGLRVNALMGNKALDSHLTLMEFNRNSPEMRDRLFAQAAEKYGSMLHAELP